MALENLGSPPAPLAVSTSSSPTFTLTSSLLIKRYYIGDPLLDFILWLIQICAGRCKQVRSGCKQVVSGCKQVSVSLSLTFSLANRHVGDAQLDPHLSRLAYHKHGGFATLESCCMPIATKALIPS